ncbi:Z-ring formation inhibitor MciZ [Paenibacillus sp.]|uniref:Z-ring formation inhibitor MciZ n=1 Tax=Paenibacillus sp. TaxID=58172 RepID=UPI002D5DF835|nr:Z-ring formation inhibitor MciZ [Paenibacillus sp.]HZG85157.1 Z-ring formation inhibitor MciZ [Paenibacillus sp.]
MKSYYGDRQMRLVGKAWQIRGKLRQLRRESGDAVSLQAMLRARTEAAFFGLESNAASGAPASVSPGRAGAERIVGDYRSYPMV